ncbi:MFS transporter [Candidatus Lokiarchaeum ossiferum]|uniref:MFS transporter n=1 Tax=Candidatus Lokiarchaeum ossiferum TaxID=2951803 RepID=UPI00352E2964
MTMDQVQTKKVEKKVFFYGFLIFLSIFANALLTSNKSEFFNALFTVPSNPLGDNQIKIMVSAFDSIYYASFLIGIPIGIISDSLKKRKIIIIIGSMGCAVLFVCMTISPTFIVVVLIRFIQGAFHVGVWQTTMVLILDESSNSNRAKHMGIFTMFLGMAMGFGTLSSGYIAEIHVFMPYYLAGGLYIVIIILTAIFVQDPEQNQTRIPISDSLILLKREPALIIPCIFNFVDRLHMGFLVTIVPLYLTQVFPLKEGLRGMILGLNALPQLLIAYPVGKKCDSDWGLYKPLITGSLCYGLILCVTGFLGHLNIGIFIFLLILGGCSMGFTTPPANALVGVMVDSKNNGMATALFNLFGNLGIVLGPLIGGLLAIISYNLSFLVAGIIEIVTLVANFYLIRKWEISLKLG